MRRLFADILLQQMQLNQSLFLITTDLGRGIWDNLHATFPSRLLNTGAAEQAAAGIAVGLALSAKIPVVYSITPFLLYRPFEIWRIYLEHEEIPIKLVGSGRGNDYARDGFTHCAEDDSMVMAALPKIEKYWPHDEHELSAIAHQFLYSPKPAYLNLKRS
jgi:transketolase